MNQRESIEDEVQAIFDSNSQISKAEAWARAYRREKRDADKRAELAKSAPNASVSKMEFEVSTEGSVGSIFKADDDFVIWGPASVEVVDKEDDRIKATALEDALPQLLKRSRLSYEHSDQIVGDILEGFSTDEPVEVDINGKSYERTDFPTDVLELEGQEPGLYVAGNVYNDTNKSQEVRKQIESGDVDSYSISGEAIVTEMAVKDGRTFTDILKIDLSAVTLCSEGMNQKAKFDVVSKMDDKYRSSLDPQRAASIAKSRLEKTMGNNNDNDDVQKFVDALDKTLDERLPNGEIATKQDVEEMVDERVKAQEGSPAEGTADRPDGDSDTPTNQEDEYTGDSGEWGQDPTEHSDKVEQTKSDSYSREELKSILPDDQFKAIEPVLDQKADEFGEPEETVDPTDERPEEMIDEPEGPAEDPMEDDPMEDEMDGPDPVMASKAVENIDLNRLPQHQALELLKAQERGRNLHKTGSGAVQTNLGVGGGGSPAHAGSDGEGAVAKADGSAVSGDPALRKIYGEDGTPQI